MKYSLLQLQQMPRPELLALGATTARRMLEHLPDELKEHRPALERAVGILERQAGVNSAGASQKEKTQRDNAPPALSDILPLTEPAFLAVKMMPAVNRRAVVAIDVIRAVGRAFHRLPPVDPPSVKQEPVADPYERTLGQIAEQAGEPEDPIVEIFDALELAGEFER